MMKNWQKIKKNPRKLEKFWVREKVIQGLRAWLAREGFHEVETPLLLPVATTEPYYEVFETQLKMFGEAPRRAWLAPSPELQMKKLLAAASGAGAEELNKIYQISKVFRNDEGRSGRHNSEFTMLEYYRGGGVKYTQLMEDMEKMIKWLGVYLNETDGNEADDEGLALNDSSAFRPSSVKSSSGWRRLKETFDLKLTYQGQKIDLSQPFERITVVEAFAKYAGVSAEELFDEKKLLAAAAKKGYLIMKETNWEEAFNQILLNEIEPYLGTQGRPTILYEYPAAQAALAQLSPADPRVAERFELWIAGVEIGNAYGELIDARIQEERLKAEVATCAKLGKTYVSDYDHDFVTALDEIKQPAAGIAIGVDRLAMLWADAATIDEVIFFPTSELF